jgi:hypothetical protein
MLAKMAALATLAQRTLGPGEPPPHYTLVVHPTANAPRSGPASGAPDGGRRQRARWPSGRRGGEQWVKERLGGYIRLSVDERRGAIHELANAKEEDFSQREIAEIVGVHESTVSRELADASPSKADKRAVQSAPLHAGPSQRSPSHPRRFAISRGSIFSTSGGRKDFRCFPAFQHDQTANAKPGDQMVHSGPVVSAIEGW